MPFRKVNKEPENKTLEECENKERAPARVSDPYSFFTDPDPEDPDGGQYGSGSNPDPGL
jgi:hypothetical protein